MEHCHLTSGCVYLKRPAVIDEHRTEVGYRHVARRLETVEYAAKVNRQRIILKRQVREEDFTTYLQLVLSTDKSLTVPFTVPLR